MKAIFLFSTELEIYNFILVPRYVYWTDWGIDAYIGKVGMDGSGKTRFHDNKSVFPNGLTIDYAAERLYWCDAHLDHISWVFLQNILIQ